MKPYYELALYNTLRDEEIVSTAFAAIKAGCNGISVRAFYLHTLKDVLPDGIVLSAPVDYPYGLLDISLRNHEIISAINKGANSIDLVANMGLIINDRIGAFEQDIRAASEICRDRAVSLRLMVEYREWDMEMLYLVADIAKFHKVNFIFPSTGHRVDDAMDNILVATKLSRTGINFIANGNINTAAHYDFFKASGLYGCRFSHIQAVHNCLGV